MRSGHYGIYKGKEYRVVFNTNDTADLVSDDKKDMETGFKEWRDGKFYKTVECGELESAYSINPKAEYRGHSVGIDKENGDEALIFTDGEYDEMKELGFKYIERGVYERWVRKADLIKIREEKVPLEIQKTAKPE